MVNFAAINREELNFSFVSRENLNFAFVSSESLNFDLLAEKIYTSSRKNIRLYANNFLCLERFAEKACLCVDALHPQQQFSVMSGLFLG